MKSNDGKLELRYLHAHDIELYFNLLCNLPIICNSQKSVSSFYEEDNVEPCLSFGVNGAIVSSTPPVQSVDAYVRTLDQSRDNQTKRGWPYSMSMGLKDVRKLWPTVSFKNSTNDNGSLLRNLHAKNQLLWCIYEVRNKIEGSCLSPTFFKVIIWRLLGVSTNEIGPWLDDKILMQKCHIAINDNQFLYYFQKESLIGIIYTKYYTKLTMEY